MNALPSSQARLVIVGATGMVGGYALRYALDHRAIGPVTAIGRRKIGIAHPKLKEVLHQDFVDCSALADALSGQDAAVFCLGAYTGAVPDMELRKVTVDYTVAFAQVLRIASPAAAFSFLSGSGADPTGRSRLAFARYKGEAENALLAAGFSRVYIFRPACDANLPPPDRRHRSGSGVVERIPQGVSADHSGRAHDDKTCLAWRQSVHNKGASSATLHSLQGLQFFAAGCAEFAHKIDRAAVDHLPQLNEALVRFRISVDNLLCEAFGDFDDLGRGQDAHPVNLCIEVDESGNIRFFVLERMNIISRGRLDELLVEVFVGAARPAQAAACVPRSDASTTSPAPRSVRRSPPSSVARAVVADPSTCNASRQRDSQTAAS